MDAPPPSEDHSIVLETGEVQTGPKFSERRGNGNKGKIADTPGRVETLAGEGSPAVNRRQEGRRASDRIKPILNKILYGTSIIGVLPSLTDDLVHLFNCETASFYSVDRSKRQIYSRTIKDGLKGEFRLDISIKSLAGFCAATGKTLNVGNPYSKKELKSYHPDLSHDAAWDRLTQTQTRSALVVALPFNKRLMGVLELLNKVGEEKFTEGDVRQARELSSTLGHALVKLELEEIEQKLQATTHAIHSAKNIDEILLELKEPILELFNANLITIYAVDPKKKEIYSKIKSGTSINEIRVPISPKSISGCVALEKRPVTLADVYNAEELQNYHPDLVFDSSWDKKTGLHTKSMLVYPLIHGDQLMGVLQLVNKNEGNQFTSFDEKNAKKISQTLALALFNQKKAARKKPTKFGYLVENEMLTQEELNEAVLKARKSNMDIEDILLGKLNLRRKDVGKSLEIFYNLPYTGYTDSLILPEQIFAGLNKNYLTRNNWVPLQNTMNQVVILIDDPSDQLKVRNIKMIFPKKKVEFQVGLKADIRDFLNSVLTEDSGPIEEPKTEAMSALLDALEDEAETSLETGQYEDEAVNAISETDSTIVRLVNKILTDAYDQGISDIHIEPGGSKKDVKVRFRKDGICSVYQEIPFLYKQAIISRIKIMARLDIAERRMPQDGKIKMRYGRKEIEYRVATCPTVGGNEDAVLRILASSKPIPLEQMFFSDRNLEMIKNAITKPFGLILVVGPTGSGKTTTLHSCLGHINTPERKIWTAEDPVEITQEGLRQVQMLDKIGLNFARAMRSFLRGDPDVIMVGEMRDQETAAIGLEASLTGHLVFSTLHTNSAPETITRLLDMGMNPLNFADALLLIAAQRLVRTLCNQCKKGYHPSREEFDTLVNEYGKKDFDKLGMQYSKDLILKKPMGCKACGDSGYSGRMALHELLHGSSEIKRKIMRKSMVDELRIQAIQDGMVTLKQDGIQKIFMGYCDLKQVLSVCIV
ncbi:MAG: ATPase, T2SS/T4P/T4SS family [Nitrospinaceae bacterium]